ncbi:hypothetical protein AB0C27_28445 [Nonomuraea sp. NPDC048882]|uniref:hypothetical protein n=1 Tax=Nonomuraea sp. NPDC048882 TaxID=3154347 RepID=UPI0033D065B2
MTTARPGQDSPQSAELVILSEPVGMAGQQGGELTPASCFRTLLHGRAWTHAEGPTRALQQVDDIARLRLERVRCAAPAPALAI